MKKVYNTQYNDVCRNCGGEGVLHTEGHDHGHGHKREPTEKVCPMCLGRGVVLVNKEIVVTVLPKVNISHAK